MKPSPEDIKILRKRMGWSQLDVARRLHLNSATMVSRYERGERQMHGAFWELLCIKACDERDKVKARFEEIERRKGSVMFVNQLIREYQTNEAP
jgi:transcriptional regulator with XRE-family HTH domain